MKQQISQALQLIRNDILEGQNIDVYIAILAGIIITFLDLFGVVNFEITIPAVLLILMLSVFSLMSI